MCFMVQLDKTKGDLCQDITISVFAYVYSTWTLKNDGKKLEGTYITEKMLRFSWKLARKLLPTKMQLSGPLLLISKVILQRENYVWGHFWKRMDERISDELCGNKNMSIPATVVYSKYVFCKYVTTSDATLNA